MRFFKIHYFLLALCLNPAAYAGLGNFHTNCVMRVLSSITGLPEIHPTYKASPIYDDVYVKIMNDPKYKPDLDTEIDLHALSQYQSDEYLASYRKNSARVQEARRMLNHYRVARSVRSKASQETKKLMDEVLRNPDRSLTSLEHSAIEKVVPVDYLRKVGHEFGPSILRSIKLGKIAPRVFLTLATSGAALSLFGEETVTPEEAEKRPNLSKDEFEVIYLSPAPHAYIRIGNTLYNYSAATIEKYPYAQHMKDDRQLSIYKSSRHIRFKTNEKEVAAFKEYLEGEVGKIYLWIPPFYSCVTASHRAIKQHTSISIPMGLDRSPGLTEGYFKLKKMMGDKSVNAIEFHPTSHSAKWKAADVFSSAVDTFLYSFMLPESMIASQVDHLPNSAGSKP